MRQRVRARQGRYIRSVLQYSILLQSHDANGFVYKPQVIKKNHDGSDRYCNNRYNNMI